MARCLPIGDRRQGDGSRRTSNGRLMMRGRVKRLAQMDAAEIRWRMRTGGRAMMDRVTTGLITPAWKREHLGVRCSRCPSLSAAREALAALRLAHRAHRARALPVIPRPSASSSDLARRVAWSTRFAAPSPTAPATRSTGADRILDGRYDLLGYRGLRFDRQPGHRERQPARRLALRSGAPAARAAVAWPSVRFLDPSCGDHKIIWELNRHQHWLTLGRAFWLTGEPKYRDRCRRSSSRAGSTPTRRCSASTGRACWSWPSVALVDSGRSASLPTIERDARPGTTAHRGSSTCCSRSIAS